MSYIGQGLPADTFQGFVTDSFTGDGSATTFTLSKEPFSEDTLIVVINNVIQKPTTNFTVSGTTLTIVGTAVASGDVIYAIHMGGPLPIGQADKLVSNNLTINDTEIDLSSGDLTLDVAGDLILDAGGSDIRLNDSGTQFGILNGTSSNFTISSTVSDKDVIVQGNDGGSTITALTLDMSDAGAATLNNGLTLTDGNLVVADGHGINFAATGDNSHTMTNELFDDYEEGTYAYTITGSNSGSLSARSGYTRGYYVKVGNMVTVNTRFETDTDNSIDGNLYFSLPFAMARPNSSDADAAIAPGYLRDNSLGTNARTGIFYLSYGNAFCYYLFTREGAANSTVEVADHGDTDAVCEGVLSFTYQTT